MLTVVASGGLSAALLGPAHATLQLGVEVSGTPLDCVDNASCDTNPAAGILQLAPNTAVNGTLVTGETSTSTGTMANPGLDLLTVGNSSVVNVSGASRTITSTVGDISFTGPGHAFSTTGAGSFVNGKGATLTYNWYIDPLNAQGANTATDTPGLLVHSFTFTDATDDLQSFSDTFAGTIAGIAGPFSMTMQAIYTLPAGASLLGRGEAMSVAAIPEPSTWAMMGVGLALMGAVGFKTKRGSISAID